MGMCQAGGVNVEDVADQLPPDGAGLITNSGMIVAEAYALNYSAEPAGRPGWR